MLCYVMLLIAGVGGRGWAQVKYSPITKIRVSRKNMRSALAGAFASGSGLPETKQERREKQEIAELKAFDATPKWASEHLLADVRARAVAEGIAPVSPAAFEMHTALVNASAIVKFASAAKNISDDPVVPEGAWWAALAPKPADAAGERMVLCLGQDGELRLRAAVAWWSASQWPASAPLRAADATKIVLIDDDDAEGKVQPPLALGHPTVDGVGEKGAPAPVQCDMHGAAVLHLAEGARLCLLARQQVSARLQRGGASADERELIKLLLREVHERLRECANNEFAFTRVYEPSELAEPVGLNRCCSAAAGLRKSYLPRSWNDRCLTCGTRHSTVENGTCKYWVRFAADAREREAAAAADATPAKAAAVTAAVTAAVAAAEAAPPAEEAVPPPAAAAPPAVEAASLAVEAAPPAVEAAAGSRFTFTFTWPPGKNYTFTCHFTVPGECI
jgi:hypothetical protein